jgi:hypothetical protein
MDELRRRELDRNQWRNLVRILCSVEAGGYPGTASVSKRFACADEADLELMAAVAGHIAGEYELSAEVQRSGDLVFVRITGGKAARASVVSRALPAEAHEAPFARLLQRVHLQPRGAEL